MTRGDVVSKANAEGWIRHRGGKCPVDVEVIVDTRHRDGDIVTGLAGSFYWRHRQINGDIMAYRIHKPAEQPEIKGVTFGPGAQAITASFDKEPGVRVSLNNPLEWRDRIRELDTQRAEVESTYQRQISEITQERESLVQKLAGEGLGLVEVVVQPVEDMSDWRNWRAGDLIRHVEGGWEDFTKGKLYQLTDVNETAVFLDDDVESRILSVDSDTIFPNGKFPAFKWHSRPAS